MTGHLTFRLAFALSFGLCALSVPANAAGFCPPGWSAYHGSCRGPQGQTTPPPKSQGGFYPVERDDHGRNDRRLRDPERYGLPTLPRGQHYEIINGRVVRIYDNRGGDGDWMLQGLMDSFLR